MQRFHLWSYGLVVALAITTLPVHADHVNINDIQPGQLALIVDDGTVNPDGTVNQWDVLYSDVNVATNFDINKEASSAWNWSLGGTVGGDADPIVTNNLTLTNATAFTQTYIITQLIGVSPVVTPASLTSGSISGSVQSIDADGATLATTNETALYSALIDGIVFKKLLDDSFSVSADPFNSMNFPSSGGDFGFPSPSFPGPAVNSTIGIQLSFTLTPGDSVSFTSNFRVEPVPIPAAIWLFGSGLLGFIVVARRKAA